MIFYTKHATKILNSVRILNSNLHLSSRIDAGKLWRQKNKLPKLQTARGPLIDLPDYSFLGLMKKKIKKNFKGKYWA